MNNPYRTSYNALLEIKFRIMTLQPSQARFLCLESITEELLRLDELASNYNTSVWEGVEVLNAVEVTRLGYR